MKEYPLISGQVGRFFFATLYLIGIIFFIYFAGQKDYTLGTRGVTLTPQLSSIFSLLLALSCFIGFLDYAISIVSIMKNKVAIIYENGKLKIPRIHWFKGLKYDILDVNKIKNITISASGDLDIFFDSKASYRLSGFFLKKEMLRGETSLPKWLNELLTEVKGEAGRF